MSSLEDVTVLRYLRSATCVNESIKDELKVLLAEIYSITGDWSQNRVGSGGNGGSTAIAATSTMRAPSFPVYPQAVLAQPSFGLSRAVPVGGSRTLGGGGGGLFSSTAKVEAMQGGHQRTHKYDNLHGTIEVIEGSFMDAEKYGFPGLYLFKTALKNFKDCVNQERQGGSTSPQLVPSCQYLKGILVMLLENQGYWEAKISGQKPRCYVKELELPNTTTANDSTVAPPQPFPPTIRPCSATVDHAMEEEEEDQPSETMEQDGSCIVNINLEDRLYSGLEHLWKNKAHADVTLLVKKKRIQAHKVILASRSEYFDRLVFGSMKESGQDEIEIKEIDNVNLFEDILEYAYTGNISFNGSIQGMFDIITLADRFGFLLLKTAVGDVLASKVNAQNVLKFLSPADAYCIENLQEKCLDQLDKISTTILSSDEFISLDPHLVKKVLSRDTFDAPEIEIFECLSKIIQKFGMVSAEASELLESCICLSSIDIKDIFSKVEPTGYFTEKVILESVRANAQNDLNLIRGRGNKALNVNVFSMASSSLHLRYCQQQPRQRGQPQPPPSLTDGIIDLNKQSSVLKITLNKAYLINVTKLEVFPNRGLQTTPRPSSDNNLCSINENDSDGLKTSFILKAIKDDKYGNGVCIANYAKYDCMGEISLVFSSQAIRYILFELKRDIPFSVRFRECLYEDHITRPIVGPDGTYAPLQEIEPLACQTIINTTDGEIYKTFSKILPNWNTETDDGILIFLCQPHYLTQIRFEKFVPSPPSVTKVFVSHTKNSEYKEVPPSCSLSDNILCGSSRFKPTVVSYIFVFIPKNKVRPMFHPNEAPRPQPIQLGLGIQQGHLETVVRHSGSPTPSNDKVHHLYCKYEPKK